MSMKFLKTVAGAAVSSLWEKVSGNVVVKDTSADVGIGTNDPAAKLDVVQDGNVSLQAHALNVAGAGYGSEAQIAVMDSATVAANIGGGINFGGKYTGNSGSEWARIKSYKENSTSGEYGGGLKLMTRDHGAGLVDALVCSPEADVTVSTGNLVIGTAGKGIDFSNQSSPAAGMTSELLDRYEEGTWTPVIEGSSGDGSFTYSTQVGFYTRIGNTMWISFYVFVNSSNVSSYPTGTIEISGLPFSVTIAAASGYQSVPTGYNNPGSGTHTYGGRWQANAATKFSQYSSASSFSGSTHMEFSGAGVLAVA